MTIETREALMAKRCVPCEGGVPRLTRDEATLQLAKLEGWTLATDGDRIRKSWTMKSFMAGMRGSVIDLFTFEPYMLHCSINAAMQH